MDTVVFRCIKGCELDIWNGSREKIAISAGEELKMTYHEYNGCIGLGKDGNELHCSPKEREQYFERVL